ncbi:unnamed protein product [Somion occarium]|uniref:Uncharacterized protein n=1 Tax=Somion occarium TaxID=3059160 RepID=A0ABP1DHB0_9APHY
MSSSQFSSLDVVAATGPVLVASVPLGLLARGSTTGMRPYRLHRGKPFPTPFPILNGPDTRSGSPGSTDTTPSSPFSSFTPGLPSVTISLHTPNSPMTINVRKRAPGTYFPDVHLGLVVHSAI